MSKRNRTKSKRNILYLPVHIAQGFEKDLEQLVLNLDSTPKNDYLKSEYKTKYLDPTVVAPDVRQTAAVRKWLQSEAKNGKTNIRLITHDDDFGWVTSDRLFDFTRALISRILGPLPDIPMGYHTNGASTRIRRGSDAAILKHAEQAHVSPSALPHWLEISKETRLQTQGLKTIDYSVLFTVDKKTEIDRVACKEPEINMFLQRSVGNLIRTRLKRIGIDLNDQSKNQELARRALQLNLATVDLSSASDNISHQLVTELLPFEWLSVMDDLRSKNVQLPSGEIHSLSMFSSMGNGFTFELESLIFYALTRAVCYFSKQKGKVSVYGDDIICPSAIVPRLERIFHFVGFSLNKKKTNSKGLYRESCGAHYYDSCPITPFYIRESVSKLSDMIRLLNRLTNWAAPHGKPWIADPALLEFRNKWADSVPRRFRGGENTDSILQLVTDEHAEQEIVFAQREIPFNHTPALEFWFTMAERRESTNAAVTRCQGLSREAYFALGLDRVDISQSVVPTVQSRAYARRYRPWL